jgi:hypothetical protein
MSLANLIVQPECAYLLTDSGLFTADGTIGALEPKMIELGDLSVAITTTGLLRASQLALAIEAVAPRDQTEMFSLLPEITFATLVAAGIDCATSHSRVLVAYYSHEEGKAGGRMLWTTPGDGPPGMFAWQMYPAWVTGMPPFAMLDRQAIFGRDLEAIDLADPALFDPMHDSIALVEAQRQWVMGWEPLPPGCYVAGDVHLTAVSARGITRTVLHSYPDEVGQKAAA